MGIIKTGISWLGTPGLSLVVVILAMIWIGIPFFGIMILAALQSVPEELYEAAEMDHATAWQKFRDITLTELKPLCVFVLITITIGAFRMIVQPMVMTGGGPSLSTYTMVYDIYETGTVNWEIGLASTMAIVFAFFVMILTVIQTILTRDKEDKNVDKQAKKN